MKKITFLILFISSFVWGQTVRVDVNELTNVSNVELLANFGGGFAFYQAANDGNGIWSFDVSTSTDAQNEYLWRVTFGDMTTQQENLTPKVGGQGIDNDVAVGQAFNTDFVNFCNRIVVIGDPDPPTFYFDSFRQPGVAYTQLTLTAPAPGVGENYYVFYSVNGFSEFGGPGTIDNGDGTYTALVRPDAAFEYKWVLNNNPGTVGADLIEDILSCTNDGVTINTDNSTFSNRIHAAGEDKMDEFSVCPNTGGGGGSTQSPYCATEVTHFGGNAGSEIDLTIINTGPTSMRVTGAAPDITFLNLVPPITGNPMTTTDTSVSGQISIDLTWAAPQSGDISFEFIQWRRNSTGGATWQLNETPAIVVPFEGVCAGPEADVTLSDLQIDMVTIEGFSPATNTYTVGLASPTPVPVVTLVETTNPNATVGTITQATAVPGTATFDVTSEDMTATQTYTINFVIEGPQSAAPTPPARDAMDVRSIFSDAYTPVTTFGYGPGADTYNTEWCAANTELVQIEGNDTNKTSGLGCEGIDFQGGRFDATDFDTLHIDLYTETPTQDASFNIILSQWSGGNGQDYPLEFSTTNASSPALPANAENGWISLDIPLDNFINNTGPSLVRDDIVQIVLVSNLGTIWYDNLYFYKDNTPANDDCANATVIESSQFGENISGSNVGATDSGIADGCSAGADVWYSFTTDADGGDLNVTIDPGFDYGIYSDCMGTLVGGCNSGLTGAPGNTTYYLRIGDETNTRAMPGGFTFLLSGSALSTDNFGLLDGLKVYPNPSNSIWNIETSNTAIEQVEVYDLLGKKVLSLEPNNRVVEIDASQFRNGLYLAKLTANGATKTIRLVKN